MNWFPIFYREILLFRRRLLRLGYVVSALVSPMLYLLAFGLGLGKRVAISGGTYLDYLLAGLIAMTSMTNSYTWIATSMTVGRLHFRTFQVYIQSPVTATDIVVGQILAGMVRGMSRISPRPSKSWTTNFSSRKPKCSWRTIVRRSVPNETGASA